MSTTKTNKTAATTIANKTTANVNQTLPAPAPIKVPQHIICKELAEKGYRAKQVSEITGISYNNVAWYFSKYGLTKIALEALGAPQSTTNKVPKAPPLPKGDDMIVVVADTKIAKPTVSKQVAKAKKQQANQNKK